eukprot:Skav202701  [mRNA]  locus=scaffold654:366071:385719:+ [translate_table: standard]
MTSCQVLSLPNLQICHALGCSSNNAIHNTILGEPLQVDHARSSHPFSISKVITLLLGPLRTFLDSLSPRSLRLAILQLRTARPNIRTKPGVLVQRFARIRGHVHNFAAGTVAPTSPKVVAFPGDDRLFPVFLHLFAFPENVELFLRLVQLLGHSAAFKVEAGVCIRAAISHQPHTEVGIRLLAVCGPAWTANALGIFTLFTKLWIPAVKELDVRQFLPAVVIRHSSTEAARLATFLFVASLWQSQILQIAIQINLQINLPFH